MPDNRNEEKKLEIATEELKIVRRFLRRNRLNEVYCVLQQIGSDVHGAKVIAGGHSVPADEKSSVVFQNVEWDSDGYFDNQEATRLTVPGGLAGRYFIQIAVRWLNTEETNVPAAIIANLKESFYYAFASLNGSPNAIDVDARSTANKVGHGATGTSQHFTFDLNLDDGDFVEINLWQDFFDPVSADVVFSFRRVGN